MYYRCIETSLWVLECGFGADMQVSTKIRAGLMAEGSDTQFDDVLGIFVNQQIADTLTEATGGDLVRFARGLVLQALQDFGFTSTWLPGVYNARIR
jgi:hypothetical protein